MVSSAEASTEDTFPCRLIINIPFPTPRLANVAITALTVDKELSPSVNRTFSLIQSVPDTLSETSYEETSSPTGSNAATSNDSEHKGTQGAEMTSILHVEYAATTNRMLRVAVNGFFESLSVVVQCMEELDVDTVMEPGHQPLDGVQGLEDEKWEV